MLVLFRYNVSALINRLDKLLRRCFSASCLAHCSWPLLCSFFFCDISLRAFSWFLVAISNKGYSIPSRSNAPFFSIPPFWTVTHNTTQHTYYTRTHTHHTPHILHSLHSPQITSLLMLLIATNLWWFTNRLSHCSTRFQSHCNLTVLYSTEQRCKGGEDWGVGNVDDRPVSAHLSGSEVSVMSHPRGCITRQVSRSTVRPSQSHTCCTRFIRGLLPARLDRREWMSVFSEHLELPVES